MMLEFHPARNTREPSRLTIVLWDPTILGVSRFWIIFPVNASTAHQCGPSSAGTYKNHQVQPSYGGISCLEEHSPLVNGCKQRPRSHSFKGWVKLSGLDLAPKTGDRVRTTQTHRLRPQIFKLATCVPPHHTPDRRAHRVRLADIVQLRSVNTGGAKIAGDVHVSSCERIRVCGENAVAPSDSHLELRRPYPVLNESRRVMSTTLIGCQPAAAL